MTDRRTKQQLLDEIDSLKREVATVTEFARSQKVEPEAWALSRCITALDALGSGDGFDRVIGKPKGSPQFVIRALMSKYRVGEVQS